MPYHNFHEFHESRRIKWQAKTTQAALFIRKLIGSSQSKREELWQEAAKETRA